MDVDTVLLCVVLLLVIYLIYTFNLLEGNKDILNLNAPPSQDCSISGGCTWQNCDGQCQAEGYCAESKNNCLSYIDEVWTDMRPLSLRKQMEKLVDNAKSNKNKKKHK